MGDVVAGARASLASIGGDSRRAPHGFDYGCGVDMRGIRDHKAGNLEDKDG